MNVEFIYGTPNRPEFGQMFGGWFTEHNGQTFLIDCGVGTGGQSLVERLAGRLDGRKLDYVLLTHIHMDHAGGLKEIMKRWPDVKILTHEKGLRHLVSPERLWLSTREVMGELAEMYGEPAPVARSSIIPHTEADLPGLAIFETPGHAPHHLSFRLGETMFAGEAGGCPYILNGRLYNRPATPPRYFPATTIRSIDVLLKEKECPAYFGHTHEMIPYHECLELYRAQLLFWEDLLRRPESARREDESASDHLERMTDSVFQEDDNLKPLNALPPVDLWRERYFMRNSVKGFLDYLAEEAGSGGTNNNAG
ncbi:hypothetical protein C4J81_15780 [Deltaproteobacteria bacterium Smac51]|nr:hypothetical protein C4J81_15780 [Deltaproteobacteria bacterium Smac51]